MEDKNYGIAQISKFISNLDLFDGKPEAIEAYAKKVNSGVLDNLTGYDIKSYKSNMAKIITLA